MVLMQMYEYIILLLEKVFADVMKTMNWGPMVSRGSLYEVGMSNSQKKIGNGTHRIPEDFDDLTLRNTQDRNCF